MKYNACKRCADSVGMINIIGNIMMIAIKGYLGVVGRSKGLIADAIHSCADLLATIVMITGLKISGRERDENYPYGYGKAEYIVAILIYFCLFLVGTYIVCEGIITILGHRKSCPGMSAAWGAIFSIAINELLFRQSVCAGTQICSPSMVAKAWESRSDVYTSIAVLIGILGSKAGLGFMDPLAAVVVGVIILKISVEMVKDSVENLLDKGFSDGEMERVRQEIGKVDGVSGIEHIRAREMGRSLEFDIEVSTCESTRLDEGERLIRAVKSAVSRIIRRQAVIRVCLAPA